MSEQVLSQFRADKVLKQEGTEICKTLGIDLKRAFYDLREQAADVPEMSLDEINTEISAVRAERKR